jgi:hypothetical protein
MNIVLNDGPGQEFLWTKEMEAAEPLLSELNIVGIDTSRAPVTMVRCSGDMESAPMPFDSASFGSLAEFRDHWDSHLAGSGQTIAVPQSDDDPLGVKAWLFGKGVVTENYPFLGYRSHIGLDFQNHGMATEFERPYVLALYASYRRRAGRVARDLWAKLFETHYLLEDIRHEVHRLCAALEDDDVEEIPF